MVIVIAYCSTYNGMGVWCTQTALAVAQLGHRSILIKSPDLTLEMPESITVFDFPEKKSNTNILPDTNLRPNKISSWIKKMEYQDGLGFVPSLVDFCSHKGIHPDFFLFNMLILCNPHVAIQQAAVNWGYPISFWKSVYKYFYGSYRPTIILWDLMRFAHWKRDLKKTPLVISLSKKMHEALQNEGREVYMMPPGVDIPVDIKSFPAKESGQVKRFLIVAHNLNQRRKGIKFLVKTLSKVDLESFQCTIVGRGSDHLLKWLKIKIPQIKHFYDLPRHEVLNLMKNHDIFLFGSRFEDWGFVQQEALACGMLVLAPNISPSDEILPDRSYLFKWGSEKSLLEKIDRILSLDDSDLQKEKARCLECYIKQHSIESYARRIDDLIHSQV